MIARLIIALLFAGSQAYGQIVEWHLKDGHTLYSEFGGVAMWGSLNYEKQWVTLAKYVGISTSAGVLHLETFGSVTKAYPLRVSAQIIKGRHRLGYSIVHLPYRTWYNDQISYDDYINRVPHRVFKVFARTVNLGTYNYTYQAPSGFFLRVDCTIFNLNEGQPSYLGGLYKWYHYYAINKYGQPAGPIIGALEDYISQRGTIYPWFGLGIGWTYDHDKAGAKRAHKMLAEPKAAHTFYVEGMGPGRQYSLNYDKLWDTRNPNFHFATGIGFNRYYNPEFTFYKPISRLDVLPIRGSILLGSGSWYFEGGITSIYQRFVEHRAGGGRPWIHSKHHLHFHTGLRYQRLEGGLFVRATIMPILFRVRSFLDYWPSYGLLPDSFHRSRLDKIYIGNTAIWPGLAVGYTIPRSKSAGELEPDVPQLD